MPGEEVVYLGINKSVPTRDNPLNIVSENMTLVVVEGTGALYGTYSTCPSKKYFVNKVSNVIRCEASPERCDEGYRTATTNSLGKKCDQPAIYNTTTKVWQIKKECLKKTCTGGATYSEATGECMKNGLAVPGNFTNYCGLNSWYKNYEIYDNNFNIIII